MDIKRIKDELENINKIYEETENNKFINLKNDDYINKISNLEDLSKDEKITIYKNIINEKYIDNELLKYLFTYYEPNKVEGFVNIINECKYIINKFHKKAGGFLFEDIQWNLHTKDDYKYELRDNEFIFDNSVNCDFDEYENKNFFISLVKIIKNISPNLIIEKRYHHDEKNNVEWYIILGIYNENNIKI